MNTPTLTMTFGAKVTHKARIAPWHKVIIRLILATLFTVGSWQVGSSAYLLAKAHLAHYLIADDCGR